MAGARRRRHFSPPHAIPPLRRGGDAASTPMTPATVNAGKVANEAAAVARGEQWVPPQFAGRSAAMGLYGTNPPWATPSQFDPTFNDRQVSPYGTAEHYQPQGITNLINNGQSTVLGPATSYVKPSGNHLLDGHTLLGAGQGGGPYGGRRHRRPGGYAILGGS